MRAASAWLDYQNRLDTCGEAFARAANNGVRGHHVMARVPWSLTNLLTVISI